MKNVIVKHLYAKSPTICTCEVASAASFKYDIKPPLACMKSSAPHSVTVAGRTQMPLCERTVFISTFVYVYSLFVYLLIYQQRKFMLPQSFLSTVHSGSQKQMCVYCYFGAKEQRVPFSFSSLMSQPVTESLTTNTQSVL